MIPIVVVTHNRHVYLDVMLRSLSATRLPRHQVLVVWDDASSDPATRAYLAGDEPVPVGHRWPRNRFWRDAGLGVIESRESAPGLAGRVHVVRGGQRSKGVVNGSYAAIRYAMDELDCGRGLLLLQDDSIFQADWFQAMMKAVRSCEGPAPGLVAGLHLTLEYRVRRKPVTFIPEEGLTAQCYLLTPAGLAALRPVCQRRYRKRTGFDYHLCGAIRRAGLGAYLVHPPIGQHFGLESRVRPHWDWHMRSRVGRIDEDATGPFVLASDIRKFAGPR